MSALVLDAAAALAWCFAEGPDAAGDALLDRVATEGALVPALWHVELAELLLAAERESRMSPGQVSAVIDSVARLPISTEGAATPPHWNDALHLARQHGLAVHDACYLDLAMRRRLPLATPLADLQRAARTSGVDVIEL